MNMPFLLRSVSVALTLALSLSACRSKTEDKPQDVTATAETVEDIQEEDAITEQHDGAKVVFSVGRDGQVKALVTTPDGKPFDQGVTGTVTVKATEPNANPVALPLLPAPKPGLLVGVIPKLEADLTEVNYELKGNGKPIQGTLHLPPGGTQELVANAKVTAKVKLTDGKKGPNGGVLQVVGEDIVEIAADKSSGAIRVYVLDDDLKPIPIADRKIKLAFVTPKGPETIVLAPEPGKLYFTGKMKVLVNPTKITVALTYHGETDVVLCGYHPGSVVVVGAAAPAFVVLVNVGWGVIVNTPAVIVDHHHHHWKGKGKGKWRGRYGGGVHIRVH